MIGSPWKPALFSLPPPPPNLRDFPKVTSVFPKLFQELVTEPKYYNKGCSFHFYYLGIYKVLETLVRIWG